MRSCGNGRENAQKQREGSSFGSGREQRSYGRGCAFVDIGSPELERCGGYLEAQPDQDERETQLEESAGAVDGAHLRQIGGASYAVDEGYAVKEEGRSERAQEEI